MKTLILLCIAGLITGCAHTDPSPSVKACMKTKVGIDNRIMRRELCEVKHEPS